MNTHFEVTKLSVLAAALMLLALSASIGTAKADDPTPPAAAPAAPATPAAPAAPAAPVAPKVPHAYAGQVTAATAGSITIQTRDGQSVVVTTDPTTKVELMKIGAVTDLKTGDAIVIGTKDDATAATTVAGTMIQVLPLLPKNAMTHAHRFAGTVATTTPALTVTTNDGKTITVTTDATTKVLETAPAALTDIVVGSKIAVRGKPDGTGFDARSIQVAPAN